MKKAVIMEIQRYSIHDGSGIRTTVFLKGCHMQCAWCHNPESQLMEAELMYFEDACIQCKKCERICDKKAHTFIGGKHELDVIVCRDCDKKEKCEEICCSESIRISGKTMSVEEVWKEIWRDKDYYGEDGGVTFSGGEPLLQEEFLSCIMSRCAEEHIGVGLDTTLNVEWKRIEKVFPYVNFYLIDIKNMNETQHLKRTGQGNTNVLENIRRLAERGSKMILRMPLLHDWNDSKEELQERYEFLKELKGIERIDFLPISNHAGKKYKALGRKMELFNQETDVEALVKNAEETWKILNGQLRNSPS